MALLWLCFTLSGAAALALEMLWMRSAGVVLGQTVETAASVLGLYFAGLGAGAWLGRAVERRPLRTYGWLEIGAGIGALWSLCVFRAAAGEAVQAWLYRVGPLGGLGLVALAMLPAAVCFGATLPALGAAFDDREHSAHRAALLYAANTLGGVLGIAATGFGLPAWIGVGASYALAATTSVGVGVIALIVARRTTVEARAAAPAEPVGIGVSHRRLRVVAAGAGALALGLEVLWTRLFAQVLHNSVYSFAAVVLVTVLAIAAGAALVGVYGPRGPAPGVAAAALILAAAGTIGGFWMFVALTRGLSYVGMRSGLGEYLLRIVGLAALTAAPAALASGAVLPVLWRSWGRDAHAARPLGDLSAANTLGGIVGALATGFLVIPYLGIRVALAAVALAYVVLADVAAPRRSSRRVLVACGVVVLALTIPWRAPLVSLQSDETLLALEESGGGIVSVVQTAGDRQLRLDNFYVLGGSAAAANERRLGLLPLLLHPDPHRALFVGLATGISASAGPAADLDETTVVELVPEVAAAARSYFAPWNGGLLERHDVRLIAGDGRRFLTATDERFDVIVSDLFVPWHAGAGSLYAREMYATAAAHLTADGVFCQWLPLYQLTREEFDLIARTFLTVFPVTTVWRADFYPDRPVVGLVGQLLPRALDAGRIDEQLARLPAWGRDPLLVNARALALLYAGDLGTATDLLPGETINTDDRPLLEFMAPRLTRINAAGDKDWFIGAPLADFVDAVAQRGEGRPDPLHLSAPLRDARRAGRALARYAIAAQQKDDRLAADLEDEVRRLVPDVIAGAETGDADGGVADARRTLASLRTEKESLRQEIEALERRLRDVPPADQDVQ